GLDGGRAGGCGPDLGPARQRAHPGAHLPPARAGAALWIVAPEARGLGPRALGAAGPASASARPLRPGARSARAHARESSSRSRRGRSRALGSGMDRRTNRTSRGAPAWRSTRHQALARGALARAARATAGTGPCLGLRFVGYRSPYTASLGGASRDGRGGRLVRRAPAADRGAVVRLPRGRVVRQRPHASGRGPGPTRGGPVREHGARAGLCSGRRGARRAVSTRALPTLHAPRPPALPEATLSLHGRAASRRGREPRREGRRERIRRRLPRVGARQAPSRSLHFLKTLIR